ncbi:hypothetical protein [Mariniflexile sp.]|uniref:hypothetical protein n=1 Tax=Mariniflexile sp. TaxID=1979402 RepID=UPI0040477E94
MKKPCIAFLLHPFIGNGTKNGTNYGKHGFYNTFSKGLAAIKKGNEWGAEGQLLFAGRQVLAH